MKLLISRDGEHIINADIDDISLVPEVAFRISQHHGPGRYVVRAGEDMGPHRAHDQIFTMTTEWMENEA